MCDVFRSIICLLVAAIVTSLHLYERHRVSRATQVRDVREIQWASSGQHSVLLASKSTSGESDPKHNCTEITAQPLSALANFVSNTMGPSRDVPSRVAAFNNLYLRMKQRNATEDTLSSEEMLKQLFLPEVKAIEPFDDMKVLLKLRKLLKHEDFNDIFKQPNVGDIL